VLWSELALTQYQVWHQLVTQIHKPVVMKLSSWDRAIQVSSSTLAAPLLQVWDSSSIQQPLTYVY
jgi:hypothetical protein